MLNEDFIIPPTLKLQGQQDALFKKGSSIPARRGCRHGKTTILLYKFVEDVKALISQGIDIQGKVWFIALSERLKKEIRANLNIFFPANLLQSVADCVISLRRFFQSLSNDEHKEKFSEHKRMTRVDFIRLFSGVKMDIDLLWEEYRGILRGYNLESDDFIISREKYTKKIGWRRGRVDIEKGSEYMTKSNQESGISKIRNDGIIWTNLD